MTNQIIRSLTFQIFAIFMISASLIYSTTEADDVHGWIEGGKWLIYLTTVASSFAYAIAMANYDADKTIKNHLPRWIYRAIILSFLPVMLFNNGGDGLKYYNLWLIPIAGASFYLAFDPMRNIFKGEDPFRIGGTSIIDRMANAVFGKFPVLYFVFKGLLFIGLFLVCLNRYL